MNSMNENFRKNKIGLLILFWHFDENNKPSMSFCIENAARMGFDGIEFLLVQMSSVDNSHLQKLKKKLFMLVLT